MPLQSQEQMIFTRSCSKAFRSKRHLKLVTLRDFSLMWFAVLGFKEHNYERQILN